MIDLIERLEKATGPSDDLDFAITQIVSPGAVWCSSAHLGFTASLEAALTLAPAEANCHGYDSDPNWVTAYVSLNHVKSGHWMREGHHPTSVAIAMCIAALRGRADFPALRSRANEGAGE